MTTTITETHQTKIQVPEIQTTETPYDKFKARRQGLIEALRSGQHKQIRQALQDGEGGFCLVGLGNHLAENEAV